jgi:uncharacterized protein (TIGR02246 family)
MLPYSREAVGCRLNAVTLPVIPGTTVAVLPANGGGGVTPDRLRAGWFARTFASSRTVTTDRFPPGGSMIRFISTCCLTLLVAACGQTRETSPGSTAGEAPSADVAADEAAIRAADSAWFSAHTAGEADAVAALYADDAVISVPGAPAARGSAAIRAAIAKDVADMKAAGLTLASSPTADLGASGDLGWIWNTFTAKDKSGATVDAGKYLTLLARRDGRWRIIRDIWNSDNAPPAPAQGASAN